MSLYDGTKTKQNLMTAFGFESQARNKYTYYAKFARDQGLMQIANIIEEIANQEMGHAKLWFKELDGMRSIEGDLQSSIAAESEENTNIYPQFAQIARSEGFGDLARVMEGVAAVEGVHEQTFRRILENYSKQLTFVSNAPYGWQCLHCGFVANSDNAPEKCPVCAHPKGYFKRKAENF